MQYEGMDLTDFKMKHKLKHLCNSCKICHHGHSHCFNIQKCEFNSMMFKIEKKKKKKKNQQILN